MSSRQVLLRPRVWVNASPGHLKRYAESSVVGDSPAFRFYKVQLVMATMHKANRCLRKVRTQICLSE